MRLLAISVIFLLSACTEQAAKDDASAVSSQVKEDALYIADETKEGAAQIAENVGDKTARVASNVRDSLKRTGHKLRKWWLTPLPEDPAPRAVAASYCYHVLQDIVCYRQPMPGWEHRLAGYQGTNAEPPPPAMMKVLPLRTANPTKAVENRIANAKPVFVGVPPDEKKSDAEEQPLSVDPANEHLPDPALAPQL